MTRSPNVVAVPWWSQSRHHHTTVSTDAIASMLITQHHQLNPHLLVAQPGRLLRQSQDIG
jgi:hypothetical protein